jgi:hypothetical protein
MNYHKNFKINTLKYSLSINLKKSVRRQNPSDFKQPENKLIPTFIPLEVSPDPWLRKNYTSFLSILPHLTEANYTGN